jgi:hypothetical protein
VNELESAKVKADLYQYLRNKNKIISPEFSKVLADVIRFAEATVRNGFEVALDELRPEITVSSTRPFIEVAEALVEHHIRFLPHTDREVTRKSLAEAYIYLAGPRYLFEPPKNTRFVHSLRRAELKKFAASVLSLHFFNLICVWMQDDIRNRLPNVTAFRVYLMNLETICRDIVIDVTRGQAGDPDEQWIMAVIRKVEAQFAIRGAQRNLRGLSVPTRQKN